MAKDFFQYDRMVADALCDVVRKVLKRTAQHGLRGNHHLFLTFKTDHPEVVLPDYLRSQFPDDMTIVLQHEFWGLTIHSDRFEVTLSFNEVHERMHIPFAALTAFADPSVQFALQLQPPATAQDSTAPAKSEAPDAEAEETPMPERRQADAHGGGTPGKIVSLDAFRKK